MAQLMPLPFTASYLSKIQIGFTFLVPAHLGSPGQRAVKRVCTYLQSRLYHSRASCPVVVVILHFIATANFYCNQSHLAM